MRYFGITKGCDLTDALFDLTDFFGGMDFWC